MFSWFYEEEEKKKLDILFAKNTIEYFESKLKDINNCKDYSEECILFKQKRYKLIIDSVKYYYNL